MGLKQKSTILYPFEWKDTLETYFPCAIWSLLSPTTSYLVKGDLLVVPVLNVEEQNHTAVLVPALQDAGVASLDGAAYGLRGQVLKQLRVIPPETHIAWIENKGADSRNLAFFGTIKYLTDPVFNYGV